MSVWDLPDPAGGAELPPAPQPEKDPFWDYRDLLLFGAAAIPSFLAAALIARGLFTAFSHGSRTQAPELLAAQFLGYGFWFTALWVFLRTRYGRPLWKSLAWVPGQDTWVRHAAEGVLLAFGVGLGAMLLQAPDIDMPIKRLLDSRLSVLLVGIAAATAGPVCEELAFRGFFMPLVIRSLGPAAGIVLTALPFALLHGPQYGWSWRHLLFIVLAGAGFGWKRYRSGSTIAAAVMHSAYNVTFFAAFVLQGKDMPTKW